MKQNKHAEQTKTSSLIYAGVNTERKSTHRL